MPRIKFQGNSYEAAAGESVLETLLRHGQPIANSCRAGACQSCLLKAAGPLPPSAQTGLKPTLAAQNYFLSCLHRPTEDLAVTLPGDGIQTEARIEAITPLSPSVLQINLAPLAPFEYRAGQYLTLFRPDGLGRSYSIASLPDAGHIHLHVRLLAGGQMSEWLRSEATPGMIVKIQGPAGNCFYTAADPQQPLLLTGAGTGLAPLYGILQDALRNGHKGPIYLYHGALNATGLYLGDTLSALDARHDNFFYRPTLMDEHGPLPDALLTAHPQLKGWRGFICGDPAIVNTLRKKLFLAGMASREISADAFLEAPRPLN